MRRDIANKDGLMSRNLASRTQTPTNEIDHSRLCLWFMNVGNHANVSSSVQERDILLCSTVSNKINTFIKTLDTSHLLYTERCELTGLPVELLAQFMRIQDEHITKVDKKTAQRLLYMAPYLNSYGLPAELMIKCVMSAKDGERGTAFHITRPTENTKGNVTYEGLNCSDHELLDKLFTSFFQRPCCT